MKTGRTRSGEDFHLPVLKYEEMFRAFLRVQSTKFVADTCGVSIKTAQRYINRGNPKRGMPPLKQRFEDAREALMAVGHLEAVEHMKVRLNQLQEMMAPITRTLIDPVTKTYYEGFEGYASPQNFVMLLEQELKMKGLIEAKERAAAEDQSREIDIKDPRARMFLVQAMKKMQAQTVKATLFNVVMSLDPEGRLGLVSRLTPTDRAIFEQALRDREQAEESVAPVGAVEAPAE